MELKKKLDLDGQIRQLQSKGITFNIIDREGAKEFLAQHTYYFRLKFYANNYTKYNTGSNKGRYQGLEFAYLKELSLLDVYLRRVLFPIVMDVEHYAKIRLLTSLQDNKREDGYKIVRELFKKEKRLERDLERKKTPYTAGLIDKYKDNFALWNIIEVMSFTQLISLYELYYNKYGQWHIEAKYFYAVRNIRNSIAHNNCLLHNLRPRGLQETDAIDEYVRELLYSIDKEAPYSILTVPFLYDFLVMLEVFDKIVTSQEEKIQQLEVLYLLVNNRFSRHMDYFEANKVIYGAFSFMLKVVSYYRRKNLVNQD